MTLCTAILLNARDLSWPGGLRYPTLVEQLQDGEVLYAEYRNRECDDVTTLPVKTEDDYRRFMQHVAEGTSNGVRFLAVKQYGRRLRSATNGYAGLVDQLRDGEVLWAKYYWFNSTDCESSHLDLVPLRDRQEYIKFMAKHWNTPQDELSFWAITLDQEKWYVQRERYGYYSPFQEDPEVTSKNQKASRRTATVVLTKDTAEAPLPDQPPALTLWTKFQLWLAGYNRRH